MISPISKIFVQFNEARGADEAEELKALAKKTADDFAAGIRKIKPKQFAAVGNLLLIEELARRLAATYNRDLDDIDNAMKLITAMTCAGYYGTSRRIH